MADPTTNNGDVAEQYLRSCTLLVADAKDNGLDLSALRIKFAVKRSDTVTPNIADIRVYNLSEDTANQIKNSFKRVILQAGYAGNFGVIFRGNIKQVIIGRESATDTFIDIIAGDGDRAYNFSVVSTTIAANSSQMDQLNACVNFMSPMGVTAGSVDPATESPMKLPRGKVMFGNARDYLRTIAQTTQSWFSIQDEKITLVPSKGYLKGERVILTSKTGMIGTPEQTNEGLNIKCLLNPNIKIGGRVQVDNKSIQRFKINLSVPNSPANIPAPLSADGTYYVLVAEHTGDTRGLEWYTTLICLNIDITSNPINSVQVGRNG